MGSKEKVWWGRAQMKAWERQEGGRNGRSRAILGDEVGGLEMAGLGVPWELVQAPKAGAHQNS